jgi:Zn-dependent M28 family amino/carboxypeptidase
MLESYFEKKKPVRMKLYLKTEFNPHAKSYNVIASIRGSKDQERIIVITSHIDTQVDSVGANDDASGIGVIYKMAKKLIEQRPSKTVRFCVFGSEEVGLLGSRYYANRLKETGELKQVEFVLCFDEVGQEEQFHRFRATNDWLLLKLRNVLNSFKATEKLGEDIIEEFPKKWKLLAFHSDHAAFVEAGIPAISIGGGGNGDYLYSHTGSSGDLDTLDRVSPKIIEYKTKIALEILKKVGV